MDERWRGLKFSGFGALDGVLAEGANGVNQGCESLVLGQALGVTEVDLLDDAGEFEQGEAVIPKHILVHLQMEVVVLVMPAS